MSDHEETESAVLEILSDVLGVPEDELRRHPVLAAHRWDSMSSLEALAQLESRFGVRLDLRSYSAARTPGDLVDLVRQDANDGVRVQ
jgi:acyl carrier protein